MQQIATTPYRVWHKASLAGALASSLVLAGCAQTSAPGYYDPPKASSQQDAIQFAEGAGTRQTVQPPSQIQIALRSPQVSQQQVAPQATQEQLTPAGQAELKQELAPAPSAQSLLIPQPLTFLGTLPCFHKDMRCSAQQVVLTVAPNGRWRARVNYLEDQKTSGQPMTTQGCWRAVPTRPPQIVLLDIKKSVRAELSMTSPDVLRLRTIDGQTPNLTYTLNRQPDLDPISELDKVTPPKCN